MIVSGGQTGVDRAALDAAIALGVEYGGWCPKGGLAEDFPEEPGLLAVYPNLQQTPLADPAQRTEWNVRDADATLVLRRADGPPSPGTALTAELASALGRPLLVLDVGPEGTVDEAVRFIDALPQRDRLNFAGPRESQAPGIYSQSRRLIEQVLTAVAAPGKYSHRRLLPE